MKLWQGALLAVGAYLVYEASQFAIAGNTLQIVFSGIQVNGVLDYTLSFVVQNVSNATLQVNSFAADVTLNGNDFGNVSGFTPTTIQPNSQQTINLSLKPSALSIPATILQLVQNPTGTFDFKVNGAMNVNNIPLPVNVEKSITV